MHIKYFIVLFSALVISSACSSDVAMLEFDGTALCVPNKYVPGLSRFGRFLEDNVDGLDESGEAEILRFPATFIKGGVQSYTVSHKRYSEVLQKHFDFEHEISGIAYNASNVGDPFGAEGTCFEFGETCSQTLIHGRVVYIYNLHESDMAVASEVKSFLASKFAEWEDGCQKSN